MSIAPEVIESAHTTIREFNAFLAVNGWPKAEHTFTGPTKTPTTATRFYSGQYGNAQRFAMLDKEGRESQVTYVISPNSLYEVKQSCVHEPALPIPERI